MLARRPAHAPGGPPLLGAAGAAAARLKHRKACFNGMYLLLAIFMLICAL